MKSEKNVSPSIKSNENTNLNQHKKDIKVIFINNLKNDPLKANELLKVEIESYYRQYIGLQLEEQSLLERKKEIQKETDNQSKEIEITSNKLEELTNAEEYKEAEMVDLRLKKLKDLVICLLI